MSRPPKYETPEEMQRVIDLYFETCRCNSQGEQMVIEDEDLELVNSFGGPVVPTVSGLAMALGMSRQALLDYQNKGEFLDTIKRAKQRIEAAVEQRLFGNNVTGVIFNLKNNFGWKDKTETEVSGRMSIEDYILGRSDKD